MEKPAKLIATSKRKVDTDRENECEEGGAKTPLSRRIESEYQSNCYIAVNENSMREVGAAIMHSYPPTLELYEYSDTSLYSQTNSLISTFSPIQVIVPMAASAMSKLISSSIQADLIIQAPKSRFSNIEGQQIIIRLSNSVDQAIMNRQLAVSAANAVILYVQSKLAITISDHSLQIAFKPLDSTLIVDTAFLSCCSVLSSPSDFTIQTSKRKRCRPTLFNVIDHTFTASGSRFLRSTLAAPPIDVATIKERQEFVQNLVESATTTEELVTLFSSLSDIDSAITFLVTKTGSSPLECFTRLSRDVSSVDSLCKILSSMECRLATNLKESLERSQYKTISNFLNVFLDGNEERILFALKPDIISILDITRKAYLEVIDDIQKYTKDLSSFHGITISIKYSKSRGFHLSIPKNQLSKKEGFKEVFKGVYAPNDLIYTEEGQNCILSTTYDLMIMDKRAKTSMEDGISISKKYLESKVEELRGFLSSIYTVSEVVSFIDCLLSFALLAKEFNYSAPQIIPDGPYIIRGARHPIVEKQYETALADSFSKFIGNSVKFVPNDCFLTPSKRMIILGGVNMSGKSTYLQTVGLISLLSLCGSFVPAEFVSIPCFHSLYFRSGFSDDLEKNMSSFSLEIQETSHIMSQADEHSLVLIDEPGASTSIEDGVAIAWAIVEHLMGVGCYGICATHFDGLREITSLYPPSRNAQMKSSPNESGHGYIHNYNVVDGKLEQKLYGIEVAKSFLPEDMVQTAECVNTKAKNMKKTKINTRPVGRHAMYSLVHKLICLKYSHISEAELKESVSQLRKKCSNSNVMMKGMKEE